MPRGAHFKTIHKPGPGRPKGSKDKLSRNIRERVIQVWDKLEKTPGKSLLVLAKKDPVWFFNTFGKALIPKEITGDISVTSALYLTPKQEELARRLVDVALSGGTSETASENT